jgi:hypothetical protein
VADLGELVSVTEHWLAVHRILRSDREGFRAEYNKLAPADREELDRQLEDAASMLKGFAGACNKVVNDVLRHVKRRSRRSNRSSAKVREPTTSDKI